MSLTAKLLGTRSDAPKLVGTRSTAPISLIAGPTKPTVHQTNHMCGPSMSDVFISYSRADKDIARGLADDLTARGLQVWWDLEVYAGQNFQNAILCALDASKVAIVIWSATAVKSAWVRDEATRAAKGAKLI